MKADIDYASLFEAKASSARAGVAGAGGSGAPAAGARAGVSSAGAAAADARDALVQRGEKLSQLSDRCVMMMIMLAAMAVMTAMVILLTGGHDVAPHFCSNCSRSVGSLAVESQKARESLAEYNRRQVMITLSDRLPLISELCSFPPHFC